MRATRRRLYCAERKRRSLPTVAQCWGFFPQAVYQERQFKLRPGDCLLTTDGVTEAADENDEEFGNERVIASARAARGLGAQGMRTRILEDVTRFCQGNFQDDASLMVVTVE